MIREKDTTTHGVLQHKQAVLFVVEGGGLPIPEWEGISQFTEKFASGCGDG